MTTKAELITWLKRPNSIRVVLVEIQNVLKPDGNSQAFYFSNKPFVSRSTDNPSNTSYTAAISGGITFSESISLDGSPNIGFGDIALDNKDNAQGADSWLNYVWVNRAINILIGDATWARADFYNIFSGVVKDIDTSDRNTINLILVNRLEKLNLAISETKVGGTGSNSDQLIPLTFGECFNVTPLLVDAATLTYQVHNGPIERIIEVRDNGAPLLGTSLPSMTPALLSQGKFQLVASPFGTITASVQGYKRGSTYQSKIGSVISNILLDYVTVTPSYSLTANTNDTNEGTTVTFTLTTADVPNGTIVAYSITGIQTADINGASLTGNFPAINNNTASVQFTITADVVAEGDETMTMSLPALSTVTPVSVLIRDTSLPITATVSNSTNTISEGGTVTFTVTTNAAFPTGTLYWSTNLTNATAADFEDGLTTGSFTVINNVGTFTRQLKADLTTEPTAESFSVTIRQGSVSGTQLVTSNVVTITDSSQTPPASATITANNNSINESGSVTFTVNTQYFSGTTLYWRTTGTVVASDFSDGVLTGTIPITLNGINGTGSLVRTMSQDLVTDNTDTFQIIISTTEGGVALQTSETITVSDSSVQPSATIVGTPASVNENTTTVTFTVNTTNFTSGTLYWTTNQVTGTIDANDFTDSQTSGTVSISGSTGTITRIIRADQFTESIPESFSISVRTFSTSGTVIGTSNTISITDSSQTPAVAATFVSPAATINENTTTTYNITTTGIASNSTLYWTISHGTTAAADFSSNSGSFVLSGTTGSFSITTTNDLTTETDPETFTLQVRTVSTSGTVIGSTAVSLVDTSKTPSATFTSPTTTINENTTTTYNISTTNVAAGSTLYWTILPGATSPTVAADFSSTSGSFVLSGTTGSFSITTTNDLTTETDPELFSIQIRTVSTSGTVIGTSPTISLTDSSKTPAVAATFVSPAATINENTTTTYNITTTGIASNSTLYWTISHGTTAAADFSSNSGSFVLSGTTGSFSITTTNDLTTETDPETFTLQVRTVSTSGTVIGSTAVSLVDSSKTPITATFTSPTTTINENTTTTYNISTTGLTSGTTLYWTILPGGTVAADFSSTSGSFALSGATGSFSITTANDLFTEDSEIFNIQIRTGSISGTVLVTSPSITLQDSSRTPVSVSYIALAIQQAA